MAFPECVAYCSRNDDLVRAFDRLTGCQLAQLGKRAPITQMIDEATGWEREQLAKFTAFVWDCVWIRLPPDVFASIP